MHFHYRPSMTQSLRRPIGACDGLLRLLLVSLPLRLSAYLTVIKLCILNLLPPFDFTNVAFVGGAAQLAPPAPFHQLDKIIRLEVFHRCILTTLLNVIRQTCCMWTL